MPRLPREVIFKFGEGLVKAHFDPEDWWYEQLKDNDESFGLLVFLQEHEDRAEQELAMRNYSTYIDMDTDY